jgi:flagellar biosynthesis/type III secretory pathway chaperone
VSHSWISEVQDYVEKLGSSADQLDRLLKQCRVDTESVETNELQTVVQQVSEHLAVLEALVARREELLGSSDAPPRGHTLTQKLQSMEEDHGPLLERFDQVSRLVADVNHRAVSLFVCQFHLAEFGSQLIRIVAGEEAKGTYSVDGSEPDPGPGGGLLDDVA